MKDVQHALWEGPSGDPPVQFHDYPPGEQEDVSSKGWRWVPVQDRQVAADQPAAYVWDDPEDPQVCYCDIPAESVEAARNRCLGELHQDFNQQLAAGVSWDGQQWGLSVLDQTNVNSINTRTQGGDGLPGGKATLGKADIAGVAHELTAAQWQELGVAMSDRIASLVADPVAGLRKHTDDIMASDNPDSLKPWSWPQ